MTSTEEAKLLREIKASIERLSGIVGPIVPSALATLDGWTWKLEGTSERRILTRGAGPVDIIPPIRAETTREKGWINSILVIFSDPNTVLRFSCDNWGFYVSPFMARTFGARDPTNTYLFCGVYNPATPLGPLYGIQWSPAQFWPYRTQIIFQAEHPRTAVTTTSQLVVASMGRHYIRDEKQFYESIFVEGKKQIIGSVEVPRRKVKVG